MSLDTNDPRSPYLQVADALREEIRSGQLAPGDRLRSVTELADRYGVAKMTVQKAIGRLRDEGLIVAWQGRGTFVREHHGGRHEADRTADGSYETIIGRLDSMLDDLQRLEQRVAALEAPTNPPKRSARRRDA